MLIAELSIITSQKTLVNYAPFVWSVVAGAHTTATYWTDIFGAQGDTDTTQIIINSVIEKPITNYSKQNDLTGCIATEKSFWWDQDNQTLYLHHTHTVAPWTDSWLNGLVAGFSNMNEIEVDGVNYSPLLKRAPSITQKANLQNYDKQAFLSGSVEFDNVGGDFDQFIESNLYGSTLDQYYADSNQQIFARNDLVPLASFFIEDYGYSLSTFTTKVQDKRKSESRRILTEKTLQDAWVPLIYGNVRNCTALVDELDTATGPVSFRAAMVLTNLGTVQVKIAEKWVNKTPTSTTLATGSFTLSATDGREGGATDGAPRECRLLEPIGIVNTYSPDVIVDLNDRAGIPYLSAYYDLTEWAAEKVALGPIGVVFDENIELVEAIKQIQNGSTKGFRYEITPTGVRTIRIDDWARDVTISDADIRDNLTLSVDTDASLLYQSVTVKYDKDFNSGKYLTVTNTDFESDSTAKYRQNKNLEIETLLTNETDANARALWSASRFSEIRPILTCELHGQQYYSARIYDMVTVNISTENRAYWGAWKAQIISIAPALDKLVNKVSMVLTERI